MAGYPTHGQPAERRLRNDDRQREHAPPSHYRLVMERLRRLTPTAQRALDAALIRWTVACLWMGIAARRVGVLLGVSSALIPTTPPLLPIYLRTRYAVAHERRAVRRALESVGVATGGSR